MNLPSDRFDIQEVRVFGSLGEANRFIAIGWRVIRCDNHSITLGRPRACQICGSGDVHFFCPDAYGKTLDGLQPTPGSGGTAALGRWLKSNVENSEGGKAA